MNEQREYLRDGFLSDDDKQAAILSLGPRQRAKFLDEKRLVERKKNPNWQLIIKLMWEKTELSYESMALKMGLKSHVLRHIFDSTKGVPLYTVAQVIEFNAYALLSMEELELCGLVSDDD